jgi:copper(I)-binding protein
MCLDVGEGFAVGDTVDLTLTFEVAGEIAVSAEIREGDDTGDDMGDHDM